MVDVDARRQDVAQGFYVAATGCFVKPWDFPLLVVKASALGHTAVPTLWQLTLCFESTNVNKKWTARALSCWTSTAIVLQAVLCNYKSFGSRRVVIRASGQ